MRHLVRTELRYPGLWRGCVGAWNPGLGPTGLTLRDWSGYGNHGTLTNMDAGTDWVVSGGRYALEHDGSNDLILCGNSPSVSTSVPFTISGWVNCYSLISPQYPKLCTFRSEQGSTPFEVTLSDQSAYRGVSIGSAGVSWGQFRNSIAFVTNAWTHIGVTYSGASGTLSTSFVIYVNGLGVPANVSGLFSGLGNTTTIGGPSSGGSSNVLLGSWDDLRLYGRVLSPQEIRLLASRRGIAYEMAPRRRSSSAVQFNRRRRLLLGST
jgi:hypothetical protein